MAARDQFTKAMAEGDQEAACSLVEEYGRGALVNAGPPEGPLPVDAAIEAGYEEAVRWMMEKGAWLSGVKYPWVEPADPSHADRLCVVHDEDHKARPGEPELGMACQHGHLGIVKLLIEKGADPEGDGGRHAPLVYAAETGRLPLVRYLLQIGVQVCVDGKGLRVLMS